MNPLEIPIVVGESLLAPEPARSGDAGVDLRSATDVDVDAHRWVAVPTGLRLALPEGFCGLVLPRSGLAATHGVTVLNAPGLIDSGFRGEVMVLLINHGDETFPVSMGDRIAQLVVAPYASPRFVTVTHLDATERGEGGFGHSGV